MNFFFFFSKFKKHRIFGFMEEKTYLLRWKLFQEKENQSIVSNEKQEQLDFEK